MGHRHPNWTMRIPLRMFTSSFARDVGRGHLAFFSFVAACVGFTRTSVEQRESVSSFLIAKRRQAWILYQCLGVVYFPTNNLELKIMAKGDVGSVSFTQRSRFCLSGRLSVGGQVIPRERAYPKTDMVSSPQPTLVPKWRHR